MLIKTLQAVAKKGAELFKKAQNRQAKQRSSQKQSGDNTARKKTTQKEASGQHGTKQERLEQKIKEDPSLRKQVDEIKAKNLDVTAEGDAATAPSSANSGDYVPNRQRSLSLDDKGGLSL